MSYQGLKLDDYTKYTGMTIDQMRDMYRDGAKKTVKIRLTLAEIIKAENIDATDDEINAEITKYAESYGSNVDDFMKNVTDDQKEYFKEVAIMNKTLQLLKEKNPAKKATKKATKKTEDGEEKPAAKKTTTKKAEDGEKKPAAKKTTTKKAEEKKSEEA
jgi:trigger factor